MKYLILVIMVVNLFSFESGVAKSFVKILGKDSAKIIEKKYGQTGLEAATKLEVKYKDKTLSKLKEIESMYGKKGLKLVARYGEVAISNPSVFKIISKYKDYGAYLVKQYPNSIEFFKKYGDKYVDLSKKFGAGRIEKYLTESEKYGADGKIISFLEKYGEKANNFLNEHWKKLLASGFVLLNADSLIESIKNVTNHAIDKLWLFIGISFLFFIFFKFIL